MGTIKDIFWSLQKPYPAGVLAAYPSQLAWVLPPQFCLQSVSMTSLAEKVLASQVLQWHLCSRVSLHLDLDPLFRAQACFRGHMKL